MTNEDFTPNDATDDQLCDDFTNQLRSGLIETVEAYLDRLEDSQRRPASDLVVKLIRREIIEHRKLGRNPVLEDYQQRFPDLELDSLKELWLLPPPRKSTREKPRLPARYTPLRELGRGGIGVVWRVFDNQLNRYLAAKLLLDRYQSDRFVNKRLEREAYLTGALQHPGVPPIHDQGRLDDGSSFFTMKLVEGETLAEILKSKSTGRAELVGIFEQVAQTVAYAHSQGIIHRDLKPQNIMVGQFGEVQIMDWGMGKRLQTIENEPSEPSLSTREESWHTRATNSLDRQDTHSNRGLTQVGDVFGTPGYMPPEQASGNVELLDERADVFALGSILAEILTGHRMLAEIPTEQLIQVSTEGELGVLPELLKQCDADPSLVQLAKHCLSTNPAERPRNGEVVADQISEYLASVDQRLRDAEIQRSQAETRALEEKKRRTLTTVLAGTILTTIAVGVAAYLWYQADQAAKSRANERQRAQTLVNALETAPPSALPFAVENLRPLKEHAVPMLQKQFREADADGQRLHYALALADFGKADVPFLVNQISVVSEAELDFLTDIIKTKQEAAELIDAKFAKQTDHDIRARLALVALKIGNVKPIEIMTSDAGDVKDRLRLIAHCEHWHGDLEPLFELGSGQHQDPVVRYSALAAIASVPVDDISSEERKKHQPVLAKLAVSSNAANVRAAAELLIRRWKLPQIRFSKQNDPELYQIDSKRDWYLNASDQVMIRVDLPIRYSGAERCERFVSDKEVTAEQFLQFVREDKQTGGRKAANPKSRYKTYREQVEWHISSFLQGNTRGYMSPSVMPIHRIGYCNALRFCNWLSRKEGLQPYYTNLSEPSIKNTFGDQRYESWDQNFNATGYRLLTNYEQAALLRGYLKDDRSIKSFYAGDYADHERYAWTSKNANEIRPVGTRLPDRYGLFDMAGSVGEYGDFSQNWTPTFNGEKLFLRHPLHGGTIETQRLDSSTPSSFADGDITADMYAGFRVARTSGSAINSFANVHGQQRLNAYKTIGNTCNRVSILEQTMSNLNHLGLMFMDIDDPAMAVQTFDEVKRHSPKVINNARRGMDAMVVLAGSQVNKALALRTLGKLEESISIADQAATSLANVVQESPATRSAKRFLKNAINVRTDSEILTLESWLQKNATDATDEAILERAFRAAEHVFQPTDQVAVNLAEVFSRHQRVADAIRWQKIAVAKTPANSSKLASRKQRLEDWETIKDND
ncbi:MAG: bifunctional serine/threonine-protein kinase/formylglycine-generating enzyme family protein [Planctomycetota bacterium]